MDSIGNKYLIIDFDSTFITTETLDELAEISLRQKPLRDQILQKIKKITGQGMNGEIPFSKSLQVRLNLISPSQDDIAGLIKILKKKITPSILRNKKFFRKFKDNIYIVSGGFKEIIAPIVGPFGISEDHILANTFIFAADGSFAGIDRENPLSQDGGKIKAVRSLNLKGNATIIGDGYTDYELKKSGVASEFIAFTENILRPEVSSLADRVVASFDEFLFTSKLPTLHSFPKSKIKVLLLENIDPSAAESFRKEGYTVTSLSKGLSEEELIKKLDQIHVLGIRSRTQITGKVLERANSLLVVGAYCIGTNQVDLPASSRHGTAVFNAPYSNTRSVVELVLAYIFSLSRDLINKNNALHRGVWDKSAAGAHELRGRTLGIVGYGNIGSQLSVLAENLGMNVIFYDIVERLALGNARPTATLPDLLKRSDIVTIHVDGRASNKNLISDKEFHLMKNGVIFLNASRGFIVDNNALINHLNSGKIKSAALDVFPAEPKSKDEEFISGLRKFDNVILTPHIGGSTEEAQKNIAGFVSGKIIDFINTGNTHLSVNFPNIQITPQRSSHRILHVHKNVPGILARINSVLAGNNINILGQYLKTNEDIGYVITDVNKRYEKKVLLELKKIPDTIRLRVLY